jgi:hypothetical protein
MLVSIGEANREHTRDPIVGMHNYTCNSIIAAMVLLHGQHTKADVLRFTDDLQKKLSDLENFDSHVGKFAVALRQLVQAGAPVQGRAAYNHFKATLSSFPAFEKHIDDYVTANPGLAAGGNQNVQKVVSASPSSSPLSPPLLPPPPPSTIQ